jgi:hypothetical protein
LTALCLQYLTFHCFELDIDLEQLRGLMGQGYLVFQEYAIANWSYHLRAMVKGADVLLGPSCEAQEALVEVDQALQDFATRYEDDLADQVRESRDNCEAFVNCGFYSILEMITEHVRQHQAKVRVPPPLRVARLCCPSLSSGSYSGLSTIAYPRRIIIACLLTLGKPSGI